MIKAIMSDIDGTLLSSYNCVTSNTVNAIKKAREKGILFGLSTGRDVKGILDLLTGWGIDGLVDLIVGSGGAEIYDFKTQAYHVRYPLEGKLIKEIITHFEGLDCNFAISEDGIFCTPKDDRHIRALSEGDLVDYKVVDYDEFLKEPRIKLIIVCDEKDMDKIVERASTFKSDQFNSSSLKTASTLYEYYDPRVTKSSGIEAILKPYNISLEEVLAFGDADNDYDMIKNVGLGVVMENGSEKTKSVAQYITQDNDHDGIGNFINQLMEENKL